MRPSIIAQSISGLIILIAVFLIYKNYNEITIKELIQMLMLIAIGIALHGVGHTFEEVLYDYNPFKMKNKFILPPDEPKGLLVRMK